jgi:hypothetical protein
MEEERIAHSTTRMRVDVLDRGQYPRNGYMRRDAEDGCNYVGANNTELPCVVRAWYVRGCRSTQPGVGYECTSKKVAGCECSCDVGAGGDVLSEMSREEVVS